MGIWYGVTAIGILGAFALLFAVLLESDNDCIAHGGNLIVVSEHQAKGTMNHTECKFDNK